MYPDIYLYFLDMELQDKYNLDCWVDNCNLWPNLDFQGCIGSMWVDPTIVVVVLQQRSIHSSILGMKQMVGLISVGSHFLWSVSWK